MKAILLVAGRSKRMKPIEDKNFLNFLGKPLIEHQIDALIRNGFDDLIIVGGKHNLDKVHTFVERKGLKNVHITEQKDLDGGSCAAILSAKEFINEEPILLLSGNDIVEDSSYELIKTAKEKEDADVYVIAKVIESYFPGGYLEVDENNYMKSIVEKPEPGTEPSNLINLVIHLHNNGKKLIEFLENASSEKDDLYEVALLNMAKSDMKVKVVNYPGFWHAVKFPWHAIKVFEFLFKKAEKKIAASAKISKNAIINGDVIIGENVKIFDGAVVTGPCYIGDDSIIGTNALVRESHLGEKCVIGFGTEVARSFLCGNVWTHTNYIGDSLIGNDVSFGSGGVCANLRLDEKNIIVEIEGNKVDTKTNKFGAVIGNNVRVGVNTSIMPGIKIGSGSFIGAGLVVAQNIPDGSFVKAEMKLNISENREKADIESRNQNFQALK